MYLQSFEDTVAENRYLIFALPRFLHFLFTIAIDISFKRKQFSCREEHKRGERNDFRACIMQNLVRKTCTVHSHLVSSTTQRILIKACITRYSCIVTFQ